LLLNGPTQAVNGGGHPFELKGVIVAIAMGQKIVYFGGLSNAAIVENLHHQGRQVSKLG
jgi:hypothetical protein